MGSGIEGLTSDSSLMNNSPGVSRVQLAFSRVTEQDVHGETYWLDQLLRDMTLEEQQFTASLFDEVNGLLENVDSTFATFVASYNSPRRITSHKEAHTRAVVALGAVTDRIVTAAPLINFRSLEALSLFVSSWATGKLMNFGLSNLGKNALLDWTTFSSNGSSPLVSLRALAERDDLDVKIITVMWYRALASKPDDCFLVTAKYVNQTLGTIDALQAVLIAEEHLALIRESDPYMDMVPLPGEVDILKQKCLTSLKKDNPEYTSFPDSWLVELAQPVKT